MENTVQQRKFVILGGVNMMTYKSTVNANQTNTKKLQGSSYFTGYDSNALKSQISENSRKIDACIAELRIAWDNMEKVT